MAINDITLTAGMRSTLTSLQTTASLFERTQGRLATGKKVNTALDDPINYFAAKGYMDRASDLNGLKDSMNEAIQTVKAADSGITAVNNLISQAKSIAQSALASSSTTDRTSFAAQYDVLRTQIDSMIADSNYKGTNLINSDTATLKVVFNEVTGSSQSSLTITGSDLTTGTTGLNLTAAAATWSGTTATETGVITGAIDGLNLASTTLRASSQTLSSNLAIVQSRIDFTSNMVNTLTKGAENLTLADMNEEGANLLMLQTRQTLSTTSLSLASQAAQSVLRLF